ncbi:MAG: CpsD/CapB family tyrosine-protein kinase [Gammaproteobacteria bacterium]|nr:CpsD/CapB family tyrosine-protein kinase [Gammaproteobacteria bacterium]
MSKIEEALKKAKELQVASGTEPSAAERSADTTAADQIARMAEPLRRSETDLAVRRVIFASMRETRIRDTFRDLRTSVLQRAGASNAVVLVTSTAENGGGSFVARNLAAAIAFDENRTALLVDCNLQEPGHDDLVLTEEPLGLTDFLRDQDVAVSEIIHPTGIPRFRVIPIGRNKDPGSEYFALLKMQRLFRELKQRYRERFVVVDAPAVGVSADVRMLAELCDIAILVVPYAGSTDTQIEAAVNAIGEQRLLGTIINDEPSSAVLGRWI